MTGSRWPLDRRRILTGVFLAFALLGGPGAGQEWTSSRHQLRGVTAYVPDTLLTFAAQVANDRRGMVDAATVAEIITQIYREDGFFLVEARVAQNGQDILVDEGYIASIDIEGVDGRHFRALEQLFAPLIGLRPLRLARFERTVMLAEDIADLDLSTELDFPGGAGARLRVLATQLRRQAGSATLDNPPRELGESVTLYAVQEFYSALIVGDLLRLEGSGTAKISDIGTRALWGALTYRAPIGSSGLYGEAFVGSVAARRNLSGEYARTDLEGRNASLALGYPVLRDVHSYGYALIEARRSETDEETGGVQFDSAAQVASVTWLYGRRFPGATALELGTTLSYGEGDTDSADANIDDGDSSFWHLRAGLGYTAPLPALSAGAAWRTEIWGQYSPDRLPSAEEFILGDRYSLRGYEFDEADGDSGVTAIFEVSHSVFPESARIDRWGPFAFLDVGSVSNNDPASFEIDQVTLASTGLGLEFDFRGNFFLSGYVGVPLKDGPLTEAGSPAAYLALTTSW